MFWHSSLVLDKENQKHRTVVLVDKNTWHVCQTSLYSFQIKFPLTDFKNGNAPTLANTKQSNVCILSQSEIDP